MMLLHIYENKLKYQGPEVAGLLSINKLFPDNNINNKRV